MAEVEYTIQGGKADADRLTRQAAVMGTSTMSFLTGAGLGPGDACLDVGCGNGRFTIDLARQVGNSGRVVGLDVDAEALEIARRSAAEAGVDVTFVCTDATSPFDQGRFDVVFARLLLSHLIDPMPVVRSMRSAARPGGIVAVEDIFTPTLHTEPAVPALRRLAAVYSATVRYHGGDPTLGPRLRAHLVRAGLTDVSERTVDNQMRTVHERMFLAQLLDNMRGAVLAAQAATAEEIDDLRADVAAAAERSDTVFVQARMYQVAGRAPTA